MESTGNCAVCGTSCRMFRDPVYMGGGYKNECPQCGPFFLSDSGYSELRRLGLHKGFVSGSIRRMAGNPPRLGEDDIKLLAQIPMPSFSERVASYLLALAEEAPELNGQVSFLRPPLAAAAYCGSKDELEFISNILEAEQMLVFLSMPFSLYITDGC